MTPAEFLVHANAAARGCLDEADPHADPDRLVDDVCRQQLSVELPTEQLSAHAACAGDGVVSREAGTMPFGAFLAAAGAAAGGAGLLGAHVWVHTCHTRNDHLDGAWHAARIVAYDEASGLHGIEWVDTEPRAAQENRDCDFRTVSLATCHVCLGEGCPTWVPGLQPIPAVVPEPGPDGGRVPRAWRPDLRRLLPGAGLAVYAQLVGAAAALGLSTTCADAAPSALLASEVLRCFDDGGSGAGTA